MKIGIAIDPYKLPIFERHLTDGFFKYKKTIGTKITTLVVETNDVAGLKKVIEAANSEAKL